MVLSERLEAILELLSEDSQSLLLDVGCDHGYICIEAVRRGLTELAIAADINKGPLSGASDNIRRAELSDRISTELSNGLKDIPSELIRDKKGRGKATLLIAGMGGALITDILRSAGEDRLLLLDRLILSPQSEPELVRHFLVDGGHYHIRDERHVLDEGKYYVLIDAVKAGDAEEICQRRTEMHGGDLEEAEAAGMKHPEDNGPEPRMGEEGSAPYSPCEYLFGRWGIRKKDPLLLEQLCRLKESTVLALERASRGSSEKAERRRKELSELIGYIDEALTMMRSR